jgi:hypothetical protein
MVNTIIPGNLTRRSTMMMSRREFLKHSAQVAGSLGLAGFAGQVLAGCKNTEKKTAADGKSQRRTCTRLATFVPASK